MKYNKGNTTIDLIATIAGSIFMIYAFLPQSTLNYIQQNISDFFTQTEQVIEYDPN